MRRTLVLFGGLAIATSAWTATAALPHEFWGADGLPGDLRHVETSGTCAASPLVELPGPTLRGRRRAPERRAASARPPDRAYGRQLFDAHWKAAFADLQRDSIGNVVTVDFPEDWLDGIAGRAPGTEEDAQHEGGAAGVLELLDERRVKALTWEAATLDQVVQYLRTITGLGFSITPRVRTDVYDEMEISLDLDDVTVRTVLDLVTYPWDLTWTAEDDLVRIATRQERPDELFIRYFDLDDLVIASERFGSAAPPYAQDTHESEPAGAQGFRTGRDELALVALIEDSLGGESAWKKPAVLEIRSHILIVRNTSPVLDRVSALLDEIRANGGVRASVEAHHWGTVSGAPPRSLDR